MKERFQRLASASLFLSLLLATGGQAFAQAPDPAPAPAKNAEGARLKAALQVAVDRAHLVDAQINCTNLVQAVQAFYEDYSRLPDVKAKGKPVPTDEPLLGILRGYNTKENPKQMIFLEAKKAKGKKREEAKGGIFYPQPGKSAILRDHWGNPYYLLFDEDYDEEIVDPFGPQERLIRGRIVIAWSAGKDGKMDLAAPMALVNRDNICSWK